MDRKKQTRQKLKKLQSLWKKCKSLLIVMQDNPDPDAIAAAVALRKLANTANLNCSIAHRGSVGRGENRALVKYLNLNLRPFSQIDIQKFDLTAMIDAQPGTGNNPFPPDMVPDIVIDHHPFRKTARKAKLSDVRKTYGATSTIMLEYLLQAGVTPDMQLATALLYGIRSDTQDLGRQATAPDIKAIQTLFPLANKRMLSEIQRGRVQREYFTILSRALCNARCYEKAIITSLEEVTIPDMVGEIADLILREDSTEWACAYAKYHDQILISIRTSQIELEANQVMHKIVSRRGTGGGHDTIAGGQIPLKKQTKSEYARLEKIIRQKCIQAIGVNENRWQKLVT